MEALDHLTGLDLAISLSARPDAPLDRLGELTGSDLAWVLIKRPDAPLDRLGELTGINLAWVLSRRPDAPLDRLGDLTGRNLAWVLAQRSYAGGTRHADIGNLEVWSWRGLLAVGCETHPYAEWIERADEIDEKHDSPGLADQTRALAKRLLAEVAR